MELYKRPIQQPSTFFCLLEKQQTMLLLRSRHRLQIAITNSFFTSPTVCFFVDLYEGPETSTFKSSRASDNLRMSKSVFRSPILPINITFSSLIDSLPTYTLHQETLCEMRGELMTGLQ
ncbi:965_t:CDS:2 [Acaulospora morrowiae]|uniref:965_t:CDS:1 n=1 Tax=Acaulospora morrowiae TaxID=94023 RepID=A0A9N8VGG3_9GLOM|nr:965_t:CDS:2 [Acaulospora morrowiae]